MTADVATQPKKAEWQALTPLSVGRRGDKDKSADIFGDRTTQSNNPLAGDGAAARPAGDQATVKSTCYRIDAAISFGNGRRVSSEVVIALGDKSEPYRVLSWQDEVEPRQQARPRRSS